MDANTAFYINCTNIKLYFWCPNPSFSSPNSHLCTFTLVATKIIPLSYYLFRRIIRLLTDLTIQFFFACRSEFTGIRKNSTFAKLIQKSFANQTVTLARTVEDEVCKLKFEFFLTNWACFFKTTLIFTTALRRK